MTHNPFHVDIPIIGDIGGAIGDMFGMGGDTPAQPGSSSPFMSFLNPNYGQTNLSLLPSMNTALGGGEYSTGLQLQQPNVPGGYHEPLGAVGPIPGIERTTSVGFLPSAGGGLSPYTYGTTGVEAAYPDWNPQTSMMDRIMGIGSEHLRLINKWAVPEETEGAFRTGREDDGWTDMTDEDVLAEINKLSEEDRNCLLYTSPSPRD